MVRGASRLWGVFTPRKSFHRRYTPPYASSSRACSLLTTARALLQERRVTHCGMPHCDMPQLHRFPPDTIVNSVACEDAVSTTPDLS